ncbi:MAG: ABC transporter ATP-binding protein [Chitinophagales bacterium]
MSIIDVLTFASIIPIIYLINDSSPIQSNAILNAIYNFMGFTSANIFILFLLLGVAFVFLVKNLFSLFITQLQNKFAFSVSEDLLYRQYDRFYNESYIEKNNKNAIDYLRYVATAPVQFSIAIVLPVFYLIHDCFVILLVATMLLFYYPVVIILVLTTIFPISFFLMKFAKRRLAFYSEELGKLELESYKIGIEGIQAYIDVKLFNKEQFFVSKIASVFKNLFLIYQKVFLFEAMPRRIIEIVVILAIGILYGVAVFFLKFTPTDLVLILITFATAAYRLMPSINEILFNIIRIKSSSYIFDYLDAVKETEPNGSNNNKLTFKQDLIWKHVSFSYPDSENVILKNISITISKGDFVVIIGESGIGKTTLGNLFAGFLQPQSGSYLIDNKPLDNFNQIKHLIAYVSQDFYLFDKSLVENIAIGETVNEIDYKRIDQVLQAVNLIDFVAALPDGLQYMVGEQGARLSGGQRQRIAVARALYKQAQILILDEITSALDKENETEILETIYKISKKNNLTVIMITHRVSSLHHFDKIYKLENANLVLMQ